MLPYNKKLKAYSRALRKNMTDAERRLWSKLRGKQIKGLQFYRQKIIGDYIVDFYCPRAKLVVEVDGGQHYIAEGIEKDRKREGCLIENFGLKVFRFSDIEVLKDIDAVVEKIWNEL